MSGQFLVGTGGQFREGNVFADRAGAVVAWLLTVGIERDGFSIREVARKRGVSVGLVQRVFETLVFRGVLKVEGVRTSKRFVMHQPQALMQDWLDQYSIVKKCKMYAYRSSYADRESALRILRKSKMRSKTALALHSAADAFGCANTNLESLELYLLDRSVRPELEMLLELEPQERGYEVLLIEPYYKTLLHLDTLVQSYSNVSPPLLTFLDLYHFPLRGLEQAEFMATRMPELNRIFARKR
jgi:hypothetical protein